MLYLSYQYLIIEVFKMNAKEKLADYQRQFGVYAEANPEVMGAFGATVTAAMENSGPLDAKTMELLILVAADSR